MTINNRDISNSGVEATGIQEGSLPAGSELLPDAAFLAALAQEYFPELSSGKIPEKEQGKTTSLSEAELKAIPETLKLDGFRLDGGDTQQLQTIQDAPAAFSFLAEARSIFAQVGYSAGNLVEASSPPVIPTSSTLPQNTRYDLGIHPVIVPAAGLSADYFDVNSVRKDFPILAEKVNGKNLIWFDNAATTQKPKRVIERLSYFYEHENSNVHRGAHTLAARATDAYESSRETVSKFLNASSAQEIVFVRGTTEAINLVAQSWGKYNIQQGDEIIISWLEHHANIVPWQMICTETGAILRVIPVDSSGQIMVDEYAKLLGPKTKIVAVTHVSNALGTITPVAELVHMAHRYGAKVLVDGAQAVSHLKVDVQALDCDFYAFSGHKIFGPTGIGALYAKSELLHAMRPYQGGGNMIVDVTFEKTVYQAPPYRFEAGTGNIADAVGLGAAIDYVNSIGIESINRYEHQLLEYGMETLQRIPGLRLIGTAKEKASVLSFVLEGFTTEEIGTALSQEGIAVRSGHHCAQPILRRHGLESTVRPSLAFYNTREEIDVLAAVIRQLRSSRNFGSFK